MPGWGDILTEVQATRDPATGGPDFDGVRHKYLRQLHELTGRSVVVYATDWLGGAGPAASITLQDMQGLMEVFRDLPGPSLDLFLHSPGGSAEAADRLVRYMRSKYSDVRVIVPLAAMSAATTLQQYWPGLLEICRNADELGRSLVEQWLSTYMLRGQLDRALKAKSIADFFADSERHKTHSKAIDRDEARAVDVTIVDLEEDQALQDAALSVHHAFMITLQGATVKIIENHLGRTFVIQQVAQMIQMPAPVVPSPPSGAPVVPQPAAP